MHHNENMMNQSHQPLDRGQPYKEMGPIQLDPSTQRLAPDLVLSYMLNNMADDFDPPEYHRTIDGALMLYEKLCTDTAFEGITRPDLFAACLDTAMIWERG